jgi:DeoR/GlpR family transcriptional regulator of sugar metabolism
MPPYSVFSFFKLASKYCCSIIPPAFKVKSNLIYHLTTYSNITKNHLQHGGAIVPQPRPVRNVLLPAERQQRILEVIRSDEGIRVSALSDLLGVSTMTVRRDLDALARKGALERTHGGALLRSRRVPNEFSYRASRLKHPRLKRRIARQAAAMIDPGDIVFLAEGATPAMVMHYLDPHLSCRVLSNNIGALSEVADKAVEFVILGGVYQPSSQALAGSVTLDMIAQVRAAKTFLSADGLSVQDGVTTQNHEIAATDRQMIRHTRHQVILMADHTKIGLVGEYVVTPINQVHTIVTDENIDPADRRQLEAQGVRLIIA